MSATASPRMTADEFLPWAEQQAKRALYELEDGEIIVDMAPERVVHIQTKFEIAYRLRLAIDAAKLPCMVMPDGVGIQIDDGTVYEPDALVRSGPKPPSMDMTIPDPMVIVEVLSPSTAARDQGAKRIGYFRMASLRHYLVADPLAKVVTHHFRGEAGEVVSTIVRDGAIRLDPPGIVLDDFWPKGLDE